MTCQMKTKVIFVFIPDGFDKKRALDVLISQYTSKLKADSPEITHHSFLIETNHDFPSDNPENLG